MAINFPLGSVEINSKFYKFIITYRDIIFAKDLAFEIPPQEGISPLIVQC